MFNWESNAGWNSDYDSTWEDDDAEEVEPVNKPPRKKMPEKRIKAAKDLQTYRHGYGQPNDDDDDDQEPPQRMLNLAFYQNRINFEPDGIRIEEVHHYWSTDYTELEDNHSYIQWLFPLRESGVNPYAPNLTIAEITKMKADENVMRRFLNSYKIMLGFYGILLDEDTGKVKRAENWKERYRVLNRKVHNNLRITRILKCLGEMGFEHLQAPLVQFFLEETLCNNKLPNMRTSVLDYFIFAVKNKNERRKLVYFAWKHYKCKKPFFWGPVDKLQKLKEEEENEGPEEQFFEAAESADVDSENNVSNPTESPDIHHELDQPYQYQQVTGIEGSLEVVGAGDALGGERLEDHGIGHRESTGYENLMMEGDNPEEIRTLSERQTTEVTEEASTRNEDIEQITADNPTEEQPEVVVFQPESPRYEERFKLLSKTEEEEEEEMEEERQDSLWEQCLSLNRFCCHVCLCSRCT